MVLDWLVSKLLKKEYTCRNCKHYYAYHFLGVSYCHRKKRELRQGTAKICKGFKLNKNNQ